MLMTKYVTAMSVKVEVVMLLFHFYCMNDCVCVRVRVYAHEIYVHAGAYGPC